MSSNNSDIFVSELEVESKILDMSICSDKNDNWLIKIKEGYFLSEEGDIIEVEDNRVPEKATVSTIIKAQQVVQKYREDIDIENVGSKDYANSDEKMRNKDSFEDFSEEKSDNKTRKQNKNDQEDVKLEGSNGDLLEEEFGVDKLKDNRNKSENKNKSGADGEQEDKGSNIITKIRSKLNDEGSAHSNDSKDSSENSDKKDQNMEDSEYDSLVSKVKSMFDSEEKKDKESESADDEILMEKEKSEKESKEDHKIEDSDKESEEILTDEEPNSQDDINTEDDSKNKRNSVSRIKSMFDSEDKKDKEGESPDDEISTDEEPNSQDDINTEDDVKSEDGILSNVKSIFNSEENADKESDLESESDNTDNNKRNEKSVIKTIKQFLSSDIADINQERPDAQNVSIDYIQRTDDGSITWSDTIKSFWSKLRKSKQGDEIAQKDLNNDVWTRYFGLLRYNSYARGDMTDVLFTMMLTAMGVILITVGIFSILTGRIGSVEAFTQSSGYADQIIITTIALSIVSISMWLSRRVATKTVASILRKPARYSALGLLTVQFAVIVIVTYILTIGGGQSALGTLEVSISEGYIIPAISLIPQYSDVILEVYNQLRGPETSLFGFNILQSSIFMSIVGSMTAYPVMKRSIARLILTTNMGPREFREETGILVEQLSETEKEYDGPKYIMGGGGTVDNADSNRAVTAEEQTIKSLDTDEQKEGLLALPEHIKGSPFADYEEVRRYWVRPPYAYVSIVYNERQNDYRYVVVEPELDESERAIFDELKERLDTVLLLEDVEEKEEYEEEVEMKLEKLETRMIELSQEYDIDINDETFHRLMYFVEREYVYYNKIDPLINDPNVEDISCDGEGKYIFVFHSDYKDIITNVKFEKDELRSFIQELAQRSGEHISAADPMVDASLPDGSRAQMTLGSEVTTKGSTFTIRLFEDIPFTPVDLLDYDTFSNTQMAYLWTAIEHNKSLIFAGGTASGKTTSMNAVSMFIPPKAKVITIEDTREISLPQENWIPGTTREGVGGEEGGDDIDMYELLRAALRQRPEYIVVGEIRGQEAETLFQAMNTGHTTYSTMHAETVDAAIGRLTNPPIEVPKQMITALDIICIQNQIRFTDDEGNAKNVRRNEETREIVGLRDNGQFQNRRPFQWDAETDTFIQSLEDSYVLSRISEENGWTPEQKREELKEREEVLEYMVEQNIREFEYVTNIIQAYMVDSEKIVSEVRNDTLEPDDLKSLTDMEWEDPDQTLNDMNSSDMPQIEGDKQ